MTRAQLDSGLIDRTTTLIAESDVDAIVVFSRQNLRHLGNLYLPHLSVVPEEYTFLIWTGDGRRKLVVTAWMQRYAAERGNDDVVAWPFGTSPWEALGRTLEEMGLANAAIGVELDYMTASDLQRMIAVVPKATLSSFDKELMLNRQIKTPAEQAIIAKVAAAGERAMMEAIELGKVGMTDREFARELRLASIRQGVDEVSWLALTWIGNEQRSDPTDMPIGAGQVFSIEFGLCIDGYYSDLQRTVAVAPIAKEVREAYRALAQVHRRTVERMRPGRRVAEVHDEFMADMAKNNLKMWDWWLGHSIGLDVHEGGSLWFREGEEAIFKAGMVFAVEPVVTSPAVLAIEDIVLVEENGSRILSSNHNWDSLAILGEPVR